MCSSAATFLKNVFSPLFFPSNAYCDEQQNHQRSDPFSSTTAMARASHLSRTVLCSTRFRNDSGRMLVRLQSVIVFLAFPKFSVVRFSSIISLWGEVRLGCRCRVITCLQNDRKKKHSVKHFSHRFAGIVCFTIFFFSLTQI